MMVWKRWSPLNMAVFGIYVRFLGGNLFKKMAKSHLARPLKRSKVSNLNQVRLCVYICIYNMCVFPKIGVFPPKWMVKIMENPIKMDDLGGKPTTYFWKHPYICVKIPWKSLGPWPPFFLSPVGDAEFHHSFLVGVSKNHLPEGSPPFLKWWQRRPGYIYIYMCIYIYIYIWSPPPQDLPISIFYGYSQYKIIYIYIYIYIYMIPVRGSLPPPPPPSHGMVPKPAFCSILHENVVFAVFLAWWVAGAVRKPANL